MGQRQPETPIHHEVGIPEKVLTVQEKSNIMRIKLKKLEQSGKEGKKFV